MPTIRKSTVVEVARNIKAFLSFEAGVTRGKVPKGKFPRGASAPGVGGSHSVKPEDLVWIFGFGRSGTTWISNMMADMENHSMWPEPMIGALFGTYYYRDGAVAKSHREGPWFVMGNEKDAWRPLLRSFVLDAAALKFPDMEEGETLVMKEPHSSMGAPLIMDALPESRMIFMMRDPRDVMASSMDSVKKGGWGGKSLNAESLPEFKIKSWSNQYTKAVNKAGEAFEAHKGPKTLVRYEDLRVEPLEEMRRIYREIGLVVDDGELARVVEKHSWENIPESEKGSGKFHRKGTPGGWREDLTDEEAREVEKATGPLIEKYYGGK